MAIAYTGNSATAATTSVSTLNAAFGSNNTAGNFLFVTTGSVIAAATSISDTLGNTFTLLDTGVQLGKIWYVKNCKGGANTITVTFPNTGPQTVAAQEFSGVDTSAPLDKQGTIQSATTPPGTTNITSTNVTPTQNGELIVVYGSTAGSGATIVIGSGYSNLLQGSAGNNGNSGLQSQVQSTAASINGTMGFTSGGGGASVNIATFKATGGAVSNNNNLLLLGAG